MVNLYLAELMSRERAAEVEQKARRYAALHPIPEETPIEPSQDQDELVACADRSASFRKSSVEAATR